MKSETYVILCHMWLAVLVLAADRNDKWFALGMCLVLGAFGILRALDERREDAPLKKSNAP